MTYAFLTFGAGWLVVVTVTALAWTALGIVGLVRSIRRRPCDAGWHSAMGVVSLVFMVDCGFDNQPFWLACWMILAIHHALRASYLAEALA